jgi:GMP synthase-like glutamine amidotransferase
MSGKIDIRIDVEAAKALIHWKSLFANEVATLARRIAAESGQPERVTLSHYRQASQLAIRALSAAILDGGPSSDDQEAA